MGKRYVNEIIIIIIITVHYMCYLLQSMLSLVVCLASLCHLEVKRLHVLCVCGCTCARV